MRGNNTIENMDEIARKSESIPGLYLGKDDGKRYLPFYKDETHVGWAEVDRSGKLKRMSRFPRRGAYSIIGMLADGCDVTICCGYNNAVMAYITCRVTAVIVMSKADVTAMRSRLEQRGHKVISEEDMMAIAESAAGTQDEGHAWKMTAAATVPTFDSPLASDAKSSGSPFGKVFSGKEMGTQIFDVNWIVRDMIPAGALLGVLYGPSGAGKTFMCMDMLLHAASGFPGWHGMPVHEARTLLVEADAPIPTNIRCASFEQVYGKAHHDRFYTYFLDVPLSYDEGYKLLQHAIDSGEVPFVPDIIVFDTLNCFYSEDENDATAFGTFRSSRLTPLMKKYECGILLITHSAKGDSTESRGSTAIKGAADYMILVDRPCPDPDVIVVSVTKNRIGVARDIARCHIESIALVGWKPDRDGILPVGGVVRCDENFVSGAALSNNARQRLDLLKEAMKAYGERDASGTWSISGNGFRRFLEEHGFSEEEIRQSCSVDGNRFFPDLQASYAVRVDSAEKDNEGEIERITVLAPAVTGELDASLLERLPESR